jgi:hypothetical protein
MTSTENPALRWHPNGTVSIDHGEMGQNFREAICAVCREPIRWSLDMFSFQTGDLPHFLTHARCAWRKSAFREQARLAPGEPS